MRRAGVFHVKTFIGSSPPPEMYGPGLEIYCRCARCGMDCNFRNRAGVEHECGSSAAYCTANPLPGREGVDRGEIECFTYEVQEEET